MENLPKFSAKYDELYTQNIIEFQKRTLDAGILEGDYVDFYPSLGSNSLQEIEFLVLGQAVNGWRSGFRLDEKIDQAKVSSSIESSNRFLSSKGHSPLDWVNVQWSNRIYNETCIDEETTLFYDSDYRAYRSFFWNVTYKLISDYYGIPQSSWEWSKKLVWSNLYKIAPDGSNPNDEQRAFQRPTAAELIRKEIEELNPKFCIVITNLSWWEPFRDLLKTTAISRDDLPPNIESLEKYRDTVVVVTTRPRFGNSQSHVNQILEVIRGIDMESPHTPKSPRTSN
jgi:hypothetical protein